MRRIGLIVLLCCAMFAPLGSAATTAAFQVAPALLDIPAIIPNAEELEAAGFDDYTLTATGAYTQADDVSYVATQLFLDEAEVDAMFTDAGRISSYVGSLSLYEDPIDPESALARELQITAYTFADDAGATDAFDVLTDERNDETAEDVEGETTFGEASELTRRSGESVVHGNLPYLELELQFQVGRLLVFGSIYVYGEDAVEADVADAEAIGDVLVERAEAVLDGDTAGLSLLVPRFPEVQGSIPYAAYWLRDGVHTPYNRESEETLDARLASYGDATDLLSYQQQIIFGDERVEDDFLYNNNLLKFDSEADAREFFELSEERAIDSPGYVNFEILDDAPEFGDASIIIDRTSILNSAEWRRYQFNILIGEYVVAGWVAQVVPDIIVPLEPLLELAEAQVQCLEDGGCADTIEIPAGITDEVAPPEDDAADPDDDSGDGDRPDIGIGRQDADATPEGDDDAPRGDISTYESPQYGYELTYDMQEWEVFAEDTDPDDAYDRISFTSTAGIDGVITIVGDPDYAPDAMSDCVADYLAGLEQSDDVSDVEPLRGEDGDEQGRAWAAYAYVLASDGGDVDAVRYIECIAFDDITIVVLQSSTDADYADLSEARVGLLEGLDA